MVFDSFRASAMPTNPIPKGTKNLTVNVPVELHEEMKRLASSSSLKLSGYIRHLLYMARDKQIIVEPDLAADEKQTPPKTLERV